MQTEQINELQRKQDAHDIKIVSLETTIKEVFPPLLDKLDALTSRLHENSEAINLHIEKSTLRDDAQKIAFDRIRLQQEKSEKNQNEDRKNFQTLKDEVIENRTILKAIKGLVPKLILFAFVVISASISIIMYK